MFEKIWVYSAHYYIFSRREEKLTPFFAAKIFSLSTCRRLEDVYTG